MKRTVDITISLIIGARPWQWCKNLVVLAPLLFSLSLLNGTRVIAGGVAFIAFCLVSGGTYLFNDLRDIKSDLNHPVKCRRPIASGKVTPRQAWTTSVCLWGLGVALGLWVNPLTGATIAAYILLTIAYTVKLKHIAVLDAVIIALGFVLRAVTGALAIRVPISPWLLACTFTLALFLGFCKRHFELFQLGDEAAGHRANLDAYSPRLLNRLVVATAILTLVVYADYTIHRRTVAFFGTRNLAWSIPFVALGLGRFLHLVLAQKQGGDATQMFLKDRWLQFAVTGWTAVVTLVIYL